MKIGHHNCFISTKILLILLLIASIAMPVACSAPPLTDTGNITPPTTDTSKEDVGASNNNSNSDTKPGVRPPSDQSPADLYGNANFENALPRLTASGTTLVDANGKTVQLGGVNLGGWLVFEEWFCPLYDNKSDEPKAAGTEIYDILLNRFTEDEVDTLISTYQDNWITTYDLDYLSSLGVNCVRVPFWYRNLQNSDGSWRLNEKGQINFDRLDWVVEECGKRNIYVILDLHGAPGFQNAAHHSGANNKCELYDDTVAGERYRLATIELWRAVASHFKGCGTVAGYDLLNEPYCDMSLTSVSYGKINDLYDRLYDAVRAVDAETICIMEGMWRLDKLPDPDERCWENVMYEVHFYDYTADAVNANAAHLSTYAKKYNVPVYVGEFESGDYETLAIEKYAAAGASFTTWTYKGASSASNWFLQYSTNLPDANIVTDSYTTLLMRWGNSIRTDAKRTLLFITTNTYTTNSALVNTLKTVFSTMNKDIPSE